MKTLVLTVFGVLSLLVGIAFLVYALRMRKNKKSTRSVLSPLLIFTAAIFASVWLVLIPVYYTSYDFEDVYSFVRPLLIAFHSAIRIFILDVEFDIVVETLRNQPEWLHVGFSLYAAALYVIAPMLTFGNVLSLFKNLWDELRYLWHSNTKHYILSALNEKSIILAKSIHEAQPDALIVFTNVFLKNEEEDYELLMQARDLQAICLKRDIAHLDFFNKKGNVEIFLIGSDESENVSQAVKITRELDKRNSKHNVKVFVFSSKPSAAYILDSVKYDNLLKYADQNKYNDNCFKLRRIDEKQQLIRKTLPGMKLFDIANRNDKTLSVMIVGFGSYGMEFFKMLVWYCQFEGYKLQINIIDEHGKKAEEKNYIESLIGRACPELLQTNGAEIDGEAQYDIRIFSGVNAMSADVDELLLSGGNEEDREQVVRRLKETNVAFVSLGDDDVNIEVAVHLRNLFDRINGVKAGKSIDWQDEAVAIYSVVYDDQKSGILYHEQAKPEESFLLRNHKAVPFHIHFIGDMSSQFSYNNIYDMDLETAALSHHTGWVEIEEAIYDDWTVQNQIQKRDSFQWWFKEEKNNEKKKKARQQYEQYEYYRNSSIAKELYQRELAGNDVLKSLTDCLKPQKKQTCECANCIRRKKSEHVRWNAYTRVTGFSYKDGIRADRALLHNDLCPWNQLSERDKLKD